MIFAGNRLVNTFHFLEETPGGPSRSLLRFVLPGQHALVCPGRSAAVTMIRAAPALPRTSISNTSGLWNPSALATYTSCSLALLAYALASRNVDVAPAEPATLQC